MPKYLHHDLARWEGEGGSAIPESVHLTHTQPRSHRHEAPELRTHSVDSDAYHDRWNILSYIDLHADARAEVQHALPIAEALRGNLTMVHLRNKRSEAVQPVNWPTNAEAADSDLNVRRVTVNGTIRGTFARYADDLGADLITLPAGYPWWQRLWRTSVANAVAASTDRPICLTNVTGPAPATRVSSIVSVLPLDGTDEAVIRFSDELAERCDATLLFLHVLPEASDALPYEVLADRDRPLNRKVAERRMREAMLRVRRPHLTAFAMGSLYRNVAKAAKEHNADLVLTRRPSGAGYGFDTGALLSKLTCPVISVAGSSSAVSRYHAAKRA